MCVAKLMDLFFVKAWKDSIVSSMVFLKSPSVLWTTKRPLSSLEASRIVLTSSSILMV